jgi:hypothetical protein
LTHKKFQDNIFFNNKILDWFGQTRVNMSNSWHALWDYDNTTENKSKQIIKFNSQSTKCWRIKLKKKELSKKGPKKNELS